MAMTVVLWTAAALGLLWELIPALAAQFGLRRLKVDIVPDPDTVLPRAGDVAYRRMFDELASLRFEPLGTNYEHAWFVDAFRWHWRSSGVHLMATPDRLTAAGIFRLIDDEPPRLVVVTAFEGGGMLQTAQPGIGAAGREYDGRLKRIEVRGLSPAAVVAHHREQAEAFRVANALVTAPLSQEGMARRSAAYTHRLWRELGAGIFWRVFKLAWGFPLLGLVVLLMSPTPADQRLQDVAVCVLGGVVTFAFLRHRFSTVVRRATILASHQPAPPPG